MHRWILLCLMIVATTANAQQLDLKSLDKFADLAKEVTQINMDDSMLKSASGLLDNKGDEAAAKKAVEGLKGLYLRVFEFEKKAVFKFEDLKPIKDQLTTPDWTASMQTRGKDELVEIWTHKTNGVADGMLLIAAEDDELVVINALGIVRAQDLGKIGGSFGIPQFGGVIK